jgi:predicted protein tyrosine phosphatase
VLAGERGAYRLAHALPSIQVPATVQAVLAARIDRLATEEKRLLQAAAVIEAYALRLLGEIASRGDPLDAETAEAHYRQALAFATELGMRPLVAHCHLGLGTLYRRIGKREPAQEHLSTAATMYREMGMRFWLAKSEQEATASD